MFLNLLGIALGLAALLLHAAVLGMAILSKINLVQCGPASSCVTLRAFFALSLGLAVQLLGLFILGAVGFLNSTSIALSALVLAGGSAVALWPARKNCLTLAAPPDYFSSLVIAAFFLLTLLVSYHPPGVWDDTMYHLPLARHYLAEQSLVLHEYVRFGLFPQNINLLMALGLLLGGDYLAQAYATVPLFIVALGLMGLAQTYCGHAFWGALGAACLIVIKPVRETLGYAYVDSGVALFCFASTVALGVSVSYRRQAGEYGGYGRHGNEREEKKEGKYEDYSWIFVAALLAGIAAGSKLFGGVLAAILGVYLLFSARAFKPVMLFGGVTLVAGIGWYLRSFLLSGDPVSPLGGPYFGYFLWDAGDLTAQFGEQRTHGVSRHPLNLLACLWQAGVIVWLLTFLGLFLRRIPRFIRVIQIIFLAYFCFWFFVSQVDRYLAPVYGAGMFLSAYTLYRLYAFVEQRLPAIAVIKKLRFLLMAGVLGGVVCVIGLAYHYRDRDLAGAIERRLGYYFPLDRETILNKRPGYALFHEAGRHIDHYGATLMQMGFENAVYFFPGLVIGDWYGPGRYRDRLDCSSRHCKLLPAAQMVQEMTRFNSRMLVISQARYPAFDPASYADYFEVVARDDNGILLLIK